MLNKETLMVFLQRILECDSEKAYRAMMQLKEILQNQGAKKELIEIIDSLWAAIPEATEVAKQEMLNDKNIEIIKKRASMRIQREIAMREAGRC